MSCYCWCREAGIVVRNLDITCGEVRVNVNEDFLLKEKGASDTSLHPTSGAEQATLSQELNKETESAKKPQGKQLLSALSKYTSMFPEKVELLSYCISFHSFLAQSSLIG